MLFFLYYKKYGVTYRNTIVYYKISKVFDSAGIDADKNDNSSDMSSRGSVFNDNQQNASCLLSPLNQNNIFYFVWANYKSDAYI